MPGACMTELIQSTLCNYYLYFQFHNSVTTSASGSDIVNFGLEIVNSVLYSYSLSFSFLILTIMQPILSGIADYSGIKVLS